MKPISLRYQLNRLANSWLYRSLLGNTDLVYQGRVITNPVLVYQMGKVASASIKISLNKVVNINVFHVHHLNPENIANIRQAYLKEGLEPLNDSEGGIFLHENLIRNQRLPVKIITLVREPIARNLSAFFHNLQSFEGMENAHDTFNITKLIDGFIQKYNHDVPLKWFDYEMHSTTGIDVYQKEFPKMQGYQFIDKDPYHLLILRHDLDDKLKEKCITEFLGLKTFCLKRSNEASSKKYAKAYKQFKSEIVLPNEYVERMLTSKYAQHFYSVEELSSISEKWTRNKKCH